MPSLDPRKDRKARIRKIRRINTEAVGPRGERTVRLVIDQQSFNINHSGMTADEANWMRTQLAVALCRFKFGD